MFSDADDPLKALVGGGLESNWIGERSESGTPLLWSTPLQPESDGRADASPPLPAAGTCISWPCIGICWRLPGYVPERHLGGYVYVLRGMPNWSDDDSGLIGPGRIVEPAPLQRVMALDRLLQRGRHDGSWSRLLRRCAALVRRCPPAARC